MKYIRGFFATIIPPLLPKPKINSEINCSHYKVNLRDNDQINIQIYSRSKSAKQLTILLHGLTGSASSHYIQRNINNLTNENNDVCCIEWRNAGHGFGLATRPYHAGLWQDLEDSLKFIKNHYQYSKLNCVGFSLGGSILLNYLIHSREKITLNKTICVSTPIDLAQSVRHMSKCVGGFFNWYFMRELKEMYEKTYNFMNKKILVDFKKIKSVEAFDHVYTSQMWGFSGAQDYYQKSSAIYHLHTIPKTHYFIHANNDPIVDIAPLLIAASKNKNFNLIVYNGGGHVGFKDRLSRKFLIDSKLKELLL